MPLKLMPLVDVATRVDEDITGQTAHDISSNEECSMLNSSA
jgi:hypothetical protein